MPTGSELNRRHIEVNETCGVCNHGTENLLHVLRDCDFSRQFWALANFPTAAIYFGAENTWDWVNGARIRLDRMEFEVFVISCWSLWYHRNKVRHDNVVSSPMETVQFVFNYTAFHRSNMYKPVGVAARSPETVQGPWSPPPPGWYKVNFDAAVPKHDALGGIAAVLRDHTGLIMAWSRK